MRKTISRRLSCDQALAQPRLLCRLDTRSCGLRGWYRLKLKSSHADLTRVGIAATGASGRTVSIEHRCDQNQFKCYIYVAQTIIDIAIDAETTGVTDAALAIRPMSTIELCLKWARRGFLAEPARFLRYFRDPLDEFLASAAYPAPNLPTDLYRRWIRTREPAFSASESARLQAIPVRERPEIGILLRVCDSEPRHLNKTLNSVIQQTSPNWKLHIADDASRDPEVRSLLSALAATDNRVTLSFREQRGGMSAATNEAFSKASSPFVGCLDHDGLLAPQAVEFVSGHLAGSSDCTLLFTDEDEIDERDRRFNPYFKPRRFSPELFYSTNYINHWAIHRADHVRALGGWRAEFDGAHDYDLNLRAIKTYGFARIEHLPHILYHRRAVAGSAAGVDDKAHATERGRLALAQHFADAPGVGVETVFNAMYRIVRPVDPARSGVAILVPFRDKPELLAACAATVLHKTAYPNLELVLIDNGSVQEDTLALVDNLGRDPRVKIIREDAPYNYARLNNLGVQATDKDFVCLLNNDVEAIEPDWLTDMMSYATAPGVGCVGAKLLYPGGSVQHAGVILGLRGVAGHAFLNAQDGAPGYFGRLQIASNFSALTGACLLLRRSVFLTAGGLDEEQLPVALNDIDLCIKVQSLGYRNVLTPFARLIHHESVSRGLDNTPEKSERARRETEVTRHRHAAILTQDPFYSPHLSLSRDFSVALE